MDTGRLPLEWPVDAVTCAPVSSCGRCEVGSIDTEALRLGGHMILMSGRPAQLEPIAELSSATPRDATDPLVLEQHAKILNRMQAELS